MYLPRQRGIELILHEHQVIIEFDDGGSLSQQHAGTSS